MEGLDQDRPKDVICYGDIPHFPRTTGELTKKICSSLVVYGSHEYWYHKTNIHKTPYNNNCFSTLALYKAGSIQR